MGRISELYHKLNILRTINLKIVFLEGQLAYFLAANISTLENAMRAWILEKISLAIFGLLAFGVALTGCVRNNCLSEHEETFMVTATSIRSATVINLCKGGYAASVQDVKISGLGQNGFYSATHDRDSQYDGSCSDGDRKKWDSVPVALTSKSFNQFKLCYDDATKVSIQLIDLNSDCPSGTRAQTQPVDDCSQLNAN